MTEFFAPAGFLLAFVIYMSFKIFGVTFMMIKTKLTLVTISPLLLDNFS